LLLGIQAVAIRAFCRLCLLTYVLNALALVALLPARQDGSVVGEAVTRREGRLAFMAWLVASLAITAGVAIAELGLRRGQAASAGAVLGIPAGPAAAGGGAGEVERYREEARAAGEQARRLQEILDDPHKLEQYFADRAAREFEQAPVHMLDLAGVPLKGPAAAPIKVVEYSDFLCPFCRNVALAFNGYLPGSGGRVGVYYKNYPLDAECNPNVRPSVHEGACLLARGAICAQDQNRFWPYHDRVFGVQLHAPRQPDVVRLATEAGLDAAGFEQCLTSASARDRLAAQIAEAQRAGVNSTPTLFINGKRLPRLADFAATVDKEAARLGLPPLPQAQAR
jgi:protein-disulfide isomerase